MKQPKNYLTLTLMSSSMILLVALQAFWLHNSYEKAGADFRGESSRLLREAVLAVRDSTLLKNIEAMPPDSTGQRSFVFSEFPDTSTAHKRHGQVRSEGQVQVYISSPSGASDSSRLLLRSIASKVHEGQIRSNSRFTIRFNNDSLNTDSIKANFSRALAKANKTVPFELRRTSGLPSSPRTARNPASPDRVVMGERPDEEDRPGAWLSKDFRTEWVRVDPMARYSALMFNVRPLLLKEITPQILFGCFLTLLTSLSFMVMYRSIRSQQRLMAIKNDFISNITHELKTPISTVSVALEALKNFKGIDNPTLTAEYLNIAQLELGRLSMLTDKVLTTSMFDEHGVTLEYEPVDLERTVNTILNSMKLVQEKLHATVSLEKTGNDFVVDGSILHLTNVVHNLLDNALKYSPSGPMITLLIKDHGNTVVLTVADKGLGIPAEYQTKIFERFFRIPTGDVHNIKGHGLGLSYVEQVVRKHGGTITVTSAPGEGSTFTVTLPKKRK